MKPGPCNLITDIAGLRVGNADDARLKSGVTVLCADAPFVAGVSVMGGAPGTRETELLAPDKLVGAVDALVLSGGSALGLAAASGVADALREAGRGFAVGPACVPIVPAAIMFDLLNGGDKGWDQNPYPALGRAALAAAGKRFAQGSAGAGMGALCADLKGGLGSASAVLPSGHVVGALVVVNAVGSALMGDGPQFRAAPWELAGEFGALGLGHEDAARLPPIKGAGPGESTTIAIVATDAPLDKAGATRLATVAHDGMARALAPSHTPLDGDLVFAVATGTKPAPSLHETAWIGHAAACCLARAIARALYLARPAPGDMLPAWRARFGR